MRRMAGGSYFPRHIFAASQKSKKDVTPWPNDNENESCLPLPTLPFTESPSFFSSAFVLFFVLISCAQCKQNIVYITYTHKRRTIVGAIDVTIVFLARSLHASDFSFKSTPNTIFVFPHIFLQLLMEVWCFSSFVFRAEHNKLIHVLCSCACVCVYEVCE